MVLLYRFEVGFQPCRPTIHFLWYFQDADDYRVFRITRIGDDSQSG